VDAGWNNNSPSGNRSHAPRKSRRLPIGQDAGVTSSASDCLEQQDFLGQRCLAGVKVRNNRKRAPAQNLVAEITH
jgi:hypothetical protein